MNGRRCWPDETQTCSGLGPGLFNAFVWAGESEEPQVGAVMGFWMPRGISKLADV